MMIGGALVNALAFSGSSYFFSKLNQSNGDRELEQKRHNSAMEELTKANHAWGQRRQQRLDFINERYRREAHALKSFQDVDIAMKEYAARFGKHLKPLGPKPVLSDFYNKSDEQEINEILFVSLGMGAIIAVAYYFKKSKLKK